ncbi:MAG: sigma-70 family RNA polymerase sigma factor [Archangiaceae bacterium]|nr:sigma-70 family RNA polymerase sigma factor [Archangiaceae bacterium]
MALHESRQEVLTKYGPYVRSLAAQVRKQFNSTLEMDELVSYGQVGLLEAAERFDAKVGANFLTFAHYRIKGAIFDGLRKMGVLKGAEARVAGASERANAYAGNLSDRDHGSNRGPDASDDVREISSAVTGLAMVFATSLEGTEGLQLSDEQLPADERLELEQMKSRVRAAIEKLPDKEKKLLQGYYFQAKTLEEAGAEIGQSKSWASRLHARAVERLKEILDEEDKDKLPEAGRRKDHGRPTGRNLGSGDRQADARAGQAAGGKAGAEQVRPTPDGQQERGGPGGPPGGSGPARSEG